MNTEQMDLARRLVQMPGWAPMPGMLMAQWAPGQPEHGKPTIRYEVAGLDDFDDEIPDITDPATAGCLLDMLGDGWAAWKREGGYQAISNTGGWWHGGETLGEAAARALLAAREDTP